jgi:predicted phosphodiesterase
MNHTHFTRPAYLVSIFAFIAVSFASIAEASPVRFALIGDRTSDAVEGVYEQAVKEIALMRPDFVVSVGDGIDGYTEDSARLTQEWDDYLALMKPITCPIYYAAGNHDIQGRVSERMFQKKIGPPNRTVTTDFGAIVFLDNSRLDRSEEFGPEQLHWLEQELAAYESSAYLMVVMHQPFWYNSTALGKPDTLHTLFVRYGVEAVFTGHFHSYFAAEFDGIKYVSVGSSGGGISPSRPGPDYHFTWVTVDDNGITVAPIALGSVMAWDIVSPADVFLASQIEFSALKFIEPLKLDDVQAGFEGRVALEISNLTDEYPWSDTLRWEVPEGWTVRPAEMSLNLVPGERAALSFRVQSAAGLYPVPSVSLAVPYSASDTCHIHADMDIDRQAPCVRVATTPTIDGKLDENCWSRMVHGLYGYEGALIVSDSTQVFFAHDDKNLYIAANCLESAMDSLTASVTERDGSVFGDDCVGFMIQPDPSIPQAFQIYVNSIGTVFDQRLYQKEDFYFTTDKTWDCDLELAIGSDDEAWWFEMSVPLNQFGVDGKTGQEMGLNFRRKMQRSSSAAHFQIPWAYEVGSYGRLIFE